MDAAFECEGAKVETRLRAEFVRVEVVALGLKERSMLAFELRLGPAPFIRVFTDGWREPPDLWSLRARPRAGFPADVFCAAAALLERAIRPGEGPSQRADFGAAMGVLRSAARAAVARIPPAARRVALRFPAPLRLRIAMLLAGDDSGRLDQLTVTCPGLLLFVLAMEDEGDAASAQAILHGVRAGRRLGELLDVAVTAWGKSNSAVVRQRQRLLMRRAGRRVEHRLLWSLPPVSFAPEDLPTRALENGRWFTAIKSAPQVLVEEGPPEVLALSRFLARSGLRLVPEMIEDLADYVLGRRRVTRVTSVPALLRAYGHWRDHEQKADPARPVKVLAQGYRSEHLVLEPLRTVGEFLEEAKRMQNCLAGRVDLAVDGEVSILRGTLNGQEVNVEVCATTGPPVLGDVRGKRNRRVDLVDREALKPWLDANGVLPHYTLAALPLRTYPMKVCELMEHVLNMLDHHSRNGGNGPIPELVAVSGLDQAWFDTLARDVLVHDEPRLVICAYDHAPGLLIALLLEDVNRRSLKLSIEEEEHFQQRAADLYRARLWFHEVEAVSTEMALSVRRRCARALPDETLVVLA